MVVFGDRDRVSHRNDSMICHANVKIIIIHIIKSPFKLQEKSQTFQIKISKILKLVRGVPFHQYPMGSVLGRRGGGGQPLNREPLVDILRPGLVVSAIIAVGQAFKAFLLAGIY